MGPASRRESVAALVAGVALAVAAGMAAFETLKELIAPGLTHWQSHMVTIAVTTLLSTTASVFIVRAQQRASAASRRNEEDLRITLEAIGDAVIATDRDGKIRRINPVAARLTGWPVEAALGRPFEEVVRILRADNRETADDPVARVIAKGETVGLGDATLLVARDGTEHPITDSAAPIRSDSGQVVGVVLVFRDVSEEHRLQEQLAQGRRMESVGRLAGGVAHDFNNLLTVILSLVKLMAEPARSDADLEDLAQIRAAAERAADLTRQLLAFARRQIVEPKVIDINGLVGNLDKMLRRLIGENIELATIPSKDLGTIRADPGQIEQVVMNLAVNARDAMPGGGTLTLETGNVNLGEDYAATHPDVTPGEYVMLSVSDTGAGMDEETIAHIFEPFFTTKAAGKGTGLGLATCYGIVKQAGGSIWVYSEPGKGTTFKVYLPRVGGALTGPEKDLASPAAHGRESILVVEDDAMVRRLAVRVLGSRGYRISEASDGVHAIEVFDKQGGEFDILITDVVMPKMSGKELADKLRERRPGLKVLFTSGYTENTIVHQGVVDVGVHFLGKPYVPAALLQRVRDVLDEKV